MPRTYKPLEQRFWEKVNKDGPIMPGMETNCWVWTATKDLDGYGRIVKLKKSLTAHRVSYKINCGPIPDNLFVCHKCDNRACVRPDHLFLGTASDNNKDMMNKGRTARGEKNGRHTHPEKIYKGEKHWTHVRPESIVRGDKVNTCKLTPTDVIKIREIWDTAKVKRGLQTKLAKEFNITQSGIWSIINRKSWKHI